MAIPNYLTLSSLKKLLAALNPRFEKLENSFKKDINKLKEDIEKEAMKNLVDGFAGGSVRGIFTREEESEDYPDYHMSECAFAEGSYTRASGYASHAEGSEAWSDGYASHAEGIFTIARCYGSHAEGDFTIASSTNQHVQGRYNVEDANNTYAFIIGNGSVTARSNALAVKWDGTIVLWDNDAPVELSPAQLKELVEGAGRLDIVAAGTTGYEADQSIGSGKFMLNATPREIRAALAFGKAINILVNPEVSTILGNTPDHPATMEFISDVCDESNGGGEMTFKFESVLSSIRTLKYTYTFEQLDTMISVVVAVW